MLRGTGLTIFSIILGAGVAAPAGATTFTYSGNAILPSTNFDRVDISSSGGFSAGPSAVGQIALTGSGGAAPTGDSGQTLYTWCLDIADALLPSNGGAAGVYTFGLPAGYVPPTPGGYATATALTSSQINQIGGLMSYGNINVNTAEVSAATQIAIWDVEYAGAGYTFSGYQYQYVGNTLELLPDPTLNNLAQTLFNEAVSGALGISGNWQILTGPNNQTLGTNAVTTTIGTGSGIHYNNSVPEPASLALLGLGLVGLRLVRGRAARHPGSVN